MKVMLLALACAACGGAAKSPSEPISPTAKPRDSSCVAVRQVSNCADLRSGVSGFYVYEILDGPDKGRNVTKRYSETAGFPASDLQYGTYELVPPTPPAREPPAETNSTEPSVADAFTQRGQWPNQCGGYEGDGYIVDLRASC